MATTPFFASGFLPRHHPLASNRLSSPGRTVVARATFSQKNIGFVCHFPLGRQIVARATDCCFCSLLCFFHLFKS